MTALSSSPAFDFSAALGRRGFVRASVGWTSSELVARREGRWLVLSRPFDPDFSAAPCGSGLGRPGLWRTIGEPGHEREVFELHESVLSFSSAEPLFAEDVDAADGCDSCLSWAVSTADGSVPQGWHPPSRAELDAMLPSSRLTVVAGSEARQGEIILAPGRLSLRFLVVARVASQLPALRRAWLARLLCETQDRWRMVRVGLSAESDEPSLLAEVDFTGAPSAVLEPLLSAGLASLHGAMAWLVETAVLLADANVACRALEFGPCPQTHPTKGKRK